MTSFYTDINIKEIEIYKLDEIDTIGMEHLMFINCIFSNIFRSSSHLVPMFLCIIFMQTPL